MEHSIECQQAMHKARCESIAYATRWPNYCQACHGNGCVIQRGDSVPYGSTWVSLPDHAEPCEKCVGLGICPRCGQHTIPEECDEPCSACRWAMKDGGMPLEPECFCWADKAEEAERLAEQRQAMQDDDRETIEPGDARYYRPPGAVDR